MTWTSYLLYLHIADKNKRIKSDSATVYISLSIIRPAFLKTCLISRLNCL